MQVAVVTDAVVVIEYGYLIFQDVIWPRNVFVPEFFHRSARLIARAGGGNIHPLYLSVFEQI